jgi:myosin heavy subunit
MLLEALSNSKNGLMAEMFEKNAPKGDKFIGTKIRKEMAELMKELNSCDVHFIRCLKPNELKKSNVLHQSNTLN